MKNIKTQELRDNYKMNFFGIVHNLTVKRKSLRINQNMMSVKCGVSLRTIQNFENNKSLDYYLIFAYRELLNNF
jgi:DNA-binding XRE family transcriptional regulator